MGRYVTTTDIALMAMEKYAGCFPLATCVGVSFSHAWMANTNADHATILLRVKRAAIGNVLDNVVAKSDVSSAFGSDGT